MNTTRESEEGVSLIKGSNPMSLEPSYVTSSDWAGVQGFEPQLADPESAVLPLNDTPTSLVRSMIP